MAEMAVLILVGATSLLALLVGARGFRLSPAVLGRAAGKALECLGAMLGFFALNLALGVTSVLVWRQLTHRFLSLYAIDDVTLLGFSFLQGLVFQWWRREGRA
jgi:hypothetical protein